MERTRNTASPNRDAQSGRLRVRAAAALALLVACAGALFWRPFGCSKVGCAKGENSWFRARYRSDISPFLTSANWGGLFALVPGAATAAAHQKGLELLGAPAVETMAGLATGGPVTCAVVGNSGNLRGSGYGSVIDSHRLVIRMNNAPVKGYESDVGTRTSISLLQNFSWPWKVYDPDTVNVLFFNDTDRHSDSPEIRRKYLDETLFFILKVNQRFQKQIREALKGKPLRTMKGPYLEGGVIFLNPDFIFYIGNNWFTPGDRAPVNHPSTGLKAVILAFHLCDEVSIFGFGANKITQTWDHYYDTGAPLAGLPLRHRPDYQKQLLDFFEEQGFVRIYRGNEDRPAAPGS